MLIEFEGRRYPYRGMDPSPRDIIKMQATLAGIEGVAATSFDGVVRIGEELRPLSNRARAEHPGFWLHTAAVLWCAMRSAGVDVDFADVIDWPLSRLKSIRSIPEPGDGAGEGEGKARPPSGSGGGNRAARRKKKAGR